jgi:hypothetical protein
MRIFNLLDAVSGDDRLRLSPSFGPIWSIVHTLRTMHLRAVQKRSPRD